MSWGEFWTVNPEAEARDKRAADHREASIAKAREALARLGDADLAAVAQAAIDLLDERFDPDEDQCPAGDDGCGPFPWGGFVHWGSVWEGEGDHDKVHEYGEDQRDILLSHGQVFRLDW